MPEAKAPEPQVNPEPQTPPVPTAEEQLKSLQAKQIEFESQLKAKDESYKGLQREINKKDAELKRASDLHSRLDNLEETQKIYAALMAEKLGENPEGDETPRKQDLLKKFDEVAAKQKQARIEADARAKQEDYFRRADDVYKSAEEVYGDDVDALANVRSLIRSGDFDLAEKKITKAKAKTQTPPVAQTQKVETEEERINRLVEERITQKIKGNPLLKTDTATAMGRVGSREEIIARYGRGEATEDDYLRAINQK